MSFTDIKTKNQGFTIVELLIVVVVIAILAAITIVSYNGITNKANASAAKSAASSVQKKAELYASDESTSGYPTNIAAMGNASDSSKAYYLTGIASGTPSSSNGKSTILYVRCGVAASGTNTAPGTISAIATTTGALIHYYDFENNRVTTTSTNPASLSVGQVSGNSGTQAIGCPTA